MSTIRVGLDNPLFAGRLRISSPANYQRRPIGRVVPRGIQDIFTAQVSVVEKAVPKTTVVNETPRPLLFLIPHTLPRKQKEDDKQKGWRLEFSRQTILFAMAGILFITGLGVTLTVLWNNYRLANQVRVLGNATAEGNLSAGQDIPTEQKPPQTSASNYVVASDMPRFIKIPSIGVDAKILRVGVDKNNNVKAPANIFDTGWYEGSSKPGEAGAMLIDGHVSGPTQNGVFYDLKKLKLDDKITIERGNGSLVNYKVVGSKVYPADKVDMGTAMTSFVSGKNGLNLITCTGKLNKATSQFEDRLVVFTVQE